MTSPSIAVQMESGKVWVDPSEDFLFMLFEEIDEGESGWLIVDQLSDTSGQTYFQSAKDVNGFIVEYRDGGPDNHFGARVSDFREAHEIATGWAFGVPGWKEAVNWSKVDFD